jgi:hypothetical protein
MRKGVVLFITLSVIAAMLAMVGVIFAYLEKSRANASYTAALIQADLLLSDSRDTITALLKKGDKDKEVKKTILSTLYLAPVTLQAEENEELFATLSCRPMDGGIDINWLGLENNSSALYMYEAAQSVFDQLVERYNVQNAALLLSRIMQALTGEGDSGEGRQGRLEQKKGIIDLFQIKEIVRSYRFEEDDSSVEEINWESYFTFDPQSKMVDGNYISAELIASYFDIELDFVKEEWFEGDDLKIFVAGHGGDASKYNSKLFSPEALERMRCRISYGYQGNVYAFGFDYLEGEAEKFEFFGKQ